MADTVSEVHDEPLPRRPRRCLVLHVACQADDLSAPPSRHRLDDIDLITFGRAPRAATRSELHGKRCLAIRVPDRRMSTDHGQIVRSPGAWQLDDPYSKNGAVVNGRPTRYAALAPSAMFQLGQTIFLLEEAMLPDDAAADVVAAPRPPPLSELVTLHAGLAADLAKLPHLAAQKLPIVVLGETGTGKEIVAGAIHALSGRKGPLIAVNCGAIPATLVESELFGHKRGAFSGATADRPGHLRAADHGTLFLDELGELSLPAQAALLRALQQDEVLPVGESLPVHVDLRVIAATHRDLNEMIQQKQLREDLYARLGGNELRLPPLRERRCDLGLLIDTLMRRHDPAGHTTISPAALRALFAYRWPQNIRQLEMVLRGGIGNATGGRIEREHLRDEIAFADEPADAEPAPVAPPPTEAEDAAQRAELIAALERHGGNVTAVAKELGVHRQQVYRWMDRFGIDQDSFRR